MKVVTGSTKVKVTGKVTKVSHQTYKIFVEGANHTSIGKDPKTKQIPIDPSNCVITDLYMNGSRAKIITRKHGEAPKK